MVLSYHDLDFKSPEEVNAWVEEYYPHGKYGLVVNFHIMMEHVEQKIKGVNDLARLKKFDKILLPSNYEAFAFTSFQNLIPKFFTKTREYRVIGQNMSHFTIIPSWGDLTSS